MKVYVDFKDLDAEDMPSNISNKYNLQIRSINGGSDYKNIKIQSLAEHDKQVRREVCWDIWKEFEQRLMGKKDDMAVMKVANMINSVLDKIGEKE